MHFKAKGNVDEGEIWYVTEVVRQTMIIDNYLIIRHWQDTGRSAKTYIFLDQ